jgi:diguanylate cyclase (GGDEF)-like protein
VDKFKQYNDSRGHLKGDELLKKVGDVVRSSIRESVDTGCRYGGDEFAVIAPEASLEKAVTIAQRIQKNFEGVGEDSLALSIGIVEFDSSDTAEVLIQYADEALYRAKRAGGNSVYPFWQGDEEETHAQQGAPE